MTASFDSYPDNQILAIQNYEPNYIYYIVFVFANMFLFSSIPGTIIFLVFKDRRSKILLADEIKQQHSLILAYITLTEDESNLSIDKLIKFLLYLYKYKIRYVEYITDICLKLDSNNNRSIVILHLFSKSTSSCSLPGSCLIMRPCYHLALMTWSCGFSLGGTSTNSCT